ncbi:MAG: hypothetical protein GWO84_00460 [Euryarchaeota archaeon]|nr:hypothetical protein [Euryarchaeota archaeon]
MIGIANNKKYLFALILTILLTQAFQPMAVESLDDDVAMLAGTPSRIEVTSPQYSMTADEVVVFEAVLYDSVNNVAQGEVTWSCSNGTIDSNGLFFPWTAGLIEIRADHASLNSTYNITVTSGQANTLRITTLSPQVLQPYTLSANEVDSRGNEKVSTDVVWTIDGDYIGQGNPQWIAEDIGNTNLRVRLNQMESNVVVEVLPGNPSEFILPEGIQVRSGQSVLLEPKLVDANGFTMNVSTAGSISWYAENGSINNQGLYQASAPGLWNISISAGGIFGNGSLYVVPANAMISQLVIMEELESYAAGTAYEIATIRTDNNGYSGYVIPPLSNWSISSGGLHYEDEKVWWTPSSTGQVTLQVVDEDVSSSLEVNVVHGNAIDATLSFSKSHLTAGTQCVVFFEAFDRSGNHWPVDGEISLATGNASLTQIESDHAIFNPQIVGTWRFEATWFDNSTDSRYNVANQIEVNHGHLSFIHLNGNSMILPADTPLLLDPQFTDAYGNQIVGVNVNWTIDDIDSTLELILSQGYFSSSIVGGHEIRANADGIFATIRLTVVAGSAQHLITDKDSGITAIAGEETDIFVQVVDIHGNTAPSNNLTNDLPVSIGVLETSSTGIGYWTFTGKTAGIYTLTIEEGDAHREIELTVLPGKAVRIEAEIDGDALSQGDIFLLRANGIDSFGNNVEIDAENTTISCTAGPTSHVTTDTWEVEITSAGNDRSCTIMWEGIIAQNFFDVESVLLGGSVGSTNTAMGLGAFLLSLVLITLVVLIRKANQVPEDEWIEDAFDYDEEKPESSASQEDEEKEQSESDSASDQQTNGDWIDNAMKTELAAVAAEVGVMQAAPGTEQGSTGWYVDVSEEVQYWDVADDGTWNRVS